MLFQKSRSNWVKLSEDIFVPSLEQTRRRKYWRSNCQKTNYSFANFEIDKSDSGSNFVANDGSKGSTNREF
jgi:hypothetical protein